MALSFSTPQGTLVIPGAYSTITVRQDASGLAANGIVVLVGEADAGPDYTLEDDLEANAFGPDQLGAVVAKYKTGRLVDAFRAASSPSADPQIQGAPTAIVLVKTNVSAKAELEVDKFDATAYGVLADKSYGKLGNLIKVSITAATSEAVPTTGTFTWIPPVDTVDAEARVNGGAALSLSIAANASPATVAAAIAGLSGVTATGGTDRAAHPGSGTVALTASGNNVTLVASATWATTPSVGDTLVIPDNSVLEGGVSTENVGAYVITAATSSTIAATKLSDAGRTGAVVGTVTAPASDVGGSAGASDMKVFAPIAASLDTANPTDGIGKTLEISALTTGNDLLTRCAYELSTTAVDWISTSATPTVIVSATEYEAQINASRQADGLQDTIVAGGEIALILGYDGTTATVTIDKDAGTFATTVVGGSGANLAITLADFATLADLAEFIATKTGYTCSVPTATLGQLPTTALDGVTAAGCATTHGAATCRIKVDAYRLFNAISDESTLLELQNSDGDVEVAAAGLPATMSAAFLAGGTKGGTTAATITAALTALENVEANFPVVLVSRDATADITDGLTESSSTYEVDAANAGLKSHVLAVSTLKRKKNRQGFGSKRGTFSAVKTAAANLATPRMSLCFQDVKLVGSTGTILQYQPYMTAVLAASMQAAGFYQAIVGKYVNCSGVLQAAGDFDDRNQSQVEQGLKAGLLMVQRERTGGFTWVSDQTTYSRDNNFVYNSIQAVYAADQVALGTADIMQRAFKGQSVADVSPGVAKATLDTAMQQWLRLKLIAPSSDAPKGYKNAQIAISGPAMVVSCEIKLAGAIYFIPISFTVSQVTQSA